MLDQTFSAKNFMTVYEREIRKGRIPLESMTTDFQEVVLQIKKTRKRLNELKSYRKSDKADKTEELLSEISELKVKLKELKAEKQEKLNVYMKQLAAQVNSRDFCFKLEKKQIHDKIGFKLDSKDYAQFFAMKQLQVNLQRTFKVKQANRHFIMSNLKLLLKTKRPFYIIRTDVSSFFESIPQDKLEHILMDNTLLSYKSKMFVKAILDEYENQKSKLSAEDSKGLFEKRGVPRGVGISSLLSEIYMRDLDNSIKKRPEVIFYARYVDDIFMLLADLPQGQDIAMYYRDLIDFFDGHGLKLKPRTDAKCRILDCSNKKYGELKVTYLGYMMTIFTTGQSKKDYSDVKLGMSSEKIKRIKTRIDNAFKHFDETNKYSLHQARKDLVDSLKLITGNVKLHGAKSGVKTGLYFNSDLLEPTDDLDVLNDYLYAKKVSLYSKLFHEEYEKKKFEDSLYERIRKFDFVKAWENKKIYELPDKRIRKIMGWLNYEEEKD